MKSRILSKRNIAIVLIMKLLTALSFLPVTAASETVAYPDIKPGYAYSLMNCDTGRVLGTKDHEVFLFEYAGGENTFYLKADGKYLNKKGSSLVLGDEKIAFTIERLNYNRYLICLGEDALVDSDGGKTNLATLTLTKKANAVNLKNCWFITGEGMTEPLRIMPIGDSLTYGNDADVPVEEHAGYRARLSRLLAEKYPNLRFVFVGSQINGGTSRADSLELYRHEGHNGHTVYYLDYGDPYYGIYQLCDEWLAKYQPDVVILMLGTNDIGLNTAKGEMAAHQTASYQRMLVQKLFEQSPLKLMVLASSPPVWQNETYNEIMQLYNAQNFDLAAKLNKSGEKVITSDVYSLIDSLGKEAFCSDNGHMSRLGYDAIADLHAAGLPEAEYIQNALQAIEQDIEVLTARPSIMDAVSGDTELTETSAPATESEEGDTATVQGNRGNTGLIVGIVAAAVVAAGVIFSVIWKLKRF